MEIPDDFEFDENEWFCEMALGIEEVRMMHELLEYFIKTWPGSPARPAEEQEFAKFMRDRMFAMRLDHQFSES